MAVRERIRNLLWYLAGLAAGWLLLPGVAHAQQQPTGDIFGNVTQIICKIGQSLSGPIALAVGFVVVAGGGLALAVGGRRALGAIAWGVIGTAVSLAAGTIILAAFGRAVCG